MHVYIINLLFLKPAYLILIAGEKILTPPTTVTTTGNEILLAYIMHTYVYNAHAHSLTHTHTYTQTHKTLKHT